MASNTKQDEWDNGNQLYNATSGHFLVVLVVPTGHGHPSQQPDDGIRASDLDLGASAQRTCGVWNDTTRVFQTSQVSDLRPACVWWGDYNGMSQFPEAGEVTHLSVGWGRARFSEVASEWSTHTVSQKLWCETPPVTIMAVACRNTFPCLYKRLQNSLCVTYNSLQRASSLAQDPGNQRGPQRGRRRRDDGIVNPSRRPMVPRTAKMAEDQDWPSVWPTAATFKPSAVPLPVRMGFPLNRQGLFSKFRT
ncbi:28S ribosomal protein S35, mitochondrial [Branchiostoma belcheri]|nr:28S ribosomal protein S35, mitochondrial [Branchiostoma belcheri]